VSGFEFGTDDRLHFDLVPLTSVVHPICCFADKDGNDSKFFSVLPKRCWSDYFSDKIVCDPAMNSEDESVEEGARDEEDSVDVSTDSGDDSE